MVLLTAILTTSIQMISYPAGSPPVVETVAELIRTELFPDAAIRILEEGEAGQPGDFQISVHGNSPWPVPADAPSDGPWMHARLNADGSGSLTASDPGFLIAMYEEMKERVQRGGGAVAELEDGVLLTPAFRWITGREDIHMSRLHYLKKKSTAVTFEDIESSFREAARLGCTHVIVNEPTSPNPHETGPDGEIYYRFYAYALDLDQYVETELNAGTYPPELLEGNLDLMKRLANLAMKYGLTPGMFIANPRSVPESLLERYPFLRGARVDHTFRAFEPRYTLTLAHPAVRWHYAEMMRKLLAEVPDLGFVITLLNDSGSGFEYTASLYPGRNGGPYVVREWRPDDEIAHAAAENVIRYYRLMRDTAREVNPDFRILTGLKNIAEEAEIILGGIDNGIDLRMRSQRSDYDDDWRKTMREFRDRGSEMTGQGLAKGNPILMGVPAPWLVAETLQDLRAAGYDHVGLDLDPVFMVEHDINREVLRTIQLGAADSAVDTAIEAAARRWVGDDGADRLIRVWRATDDAVRTAPRPALYGGQGFVWYRFWVRPFVPDIGKIPESDRAYYQDYMLSVFNNPHNIDFGADALWTIHPPEEADSLYRRFDRDVWGRLEQAIEIVTQASDDDGLGDRARLFMDETRDRLLAYRAYCRTVRNTLAWIAGVHGYIDSEDEDAKAGWKAVVEEVVAGELANTRELLELWETSDVNFIPITETGETMHTYGLNLGDHLRRKIALMEQYGDAEPNIDPNYMWRMPDGSDLDEEKYRGY